MADSNCPDSADNFYRGRRLRANPWIREMVQETFILPQQLIQPYFIVEQDQNFEQEIASMPGQYKLGIEKLLQHIDKAIQAGLRAVLLFGIPEEKDETGSQAWNAKGVIQEAVKKLKAKFPELCVITDVCLCEYTSHGHCGLLSGKGEVENDSTLKLLDKTAVSHAEAGADMIAPSDMMDGRIATIRQALDLAGFEQLPIMSYAAKYASSFYGPFREAAENAPQHGDRKAYQMDPANSREALREALADQEEGADILMVKPALPYLDIIRLVRDATNLPLAAYQVSGEYAMLKAAFASGLLDAERAIRETLFSIKRAGADMIISYFTVEYLRNNF